MFGNGFQTQFLIKHAYGFRIGAVRSCVWKYAEAIKPNGGIKMSVISMKQLLEAGVHFGHQTRRWNPKMAEYI